MGPLFVAESISSEKSLLPQASQILLGCVWKELFNVRCGDSLTGTNQHPEALPPHEEAAHEEERPTRGPAAARETARDKPLDRSGPVRAEFRAGELLGLRRHEGVWHRHALSMLNGDGLKDLLPTLPAPISDMAAKLLQASSSAQRRPMHSLHCKSS